MAKSIVDRILDETRERLASRHEVQNLTGGSPSTQEDHQANHPGTAYALADEIMSKIANELPPRVKETVAAEVQASIRPFQREVQELVRNLARAQDDKLGQKPGSEHSALRQLASIHEDETEESLAPPTEFEFPMDEPRAQLDQGPVRPRHLLSQIDRILPQLVRCDSQWNVKWNNWI